MRQLQYIIAMKICWADDIEHKVLVLATQHPMELPQALHTMSADEP